MNTKAIAKALQEANAVCLGVPHGIEPPKDDPVLPKDVVISSLRVEVSRYRWKNLQLRKERARLRDALNSIKWASADMDNMEFLAKITCFQMDKIMEALGDTVDHSSVK